MWRVQYRRLPLTWPMAYTTACTTVQAVISSKVDQHSTLLINNYKFSSEKITSFSRNLYTIEHCSPLKVAEKNLTERHINHYTVAMISVMLRSLRRICNAIFCNYYFHFYREGDN